MARIFFLSGEMGHQVITQKQIKYTKKNRYKYTNRITNEQTHKYTNKTLHL